MLLWTKLLVETDCPYLTPKAQRVNQKHVQKKRGNILVKTRNQKIADLTVVLFCLL